VVRAWDRARRVPLGEPRSILPKSASASFGSISHSGRPNQVRTCSRFPTSPRMVLSARPADARASTNPANTSVSNRVSSSNEAGARSSRGSRTTASDANPSPLAFDQTDVRPDKVRTLQESRSYVTQQQDTRRRQNSLTTRARSHPGPGELTGCRTSWTWRPASVWTCCPTAPRRRSPPGCAPIPGPCRGACPVRQGRADRGDRQTLHLDCKTVRRYAHALGPAPAATARSTPMRPIRTGGGTRAVQTRHGFTRKSPISATSAASGLSAVTWNRSAPAASPHHPRSPRNSPSGKPPG
jgi:hypothetical protein